MGREKKLAFIQSSISVPRASEGENFEGFKNYLVVSEVCAETRKVLRSYNVEIEEYWDTFSDAINRENRYKVIFN